MSSSTAGLRFTKNLSKSLLPLLAAVLISCGGGGGGGSTPPPLPPADLPGAWISQDQGQNTYLLVLPASLGALFPVASLNDQTLLQVTGAVLYSDGQLAGNNATLLGSAATPLPGGATTLEASILGAAATGPQNQLNAAFISALGRVVRKFNPDSAASGPVQLADLAGSYDGPQARTSTGLGTTLTIATDGTLTGNDTQGSLAGTVSQLRNLNTFNVNFRYTPTDTTRPALRFSGYAYLRSGTQPALGIHHHRRHKHCRGRERYATVGDLHEASLI